jgi:hypothetical protein
MKATPHQAQRFGALEFFPETGPGARVLLRLGGRGVQHVGGMHENEAPFDTRRVDRRSEALRALRLDRDLLVVVLRWRGEQLHRAHPAPRRPPHGHVDAAVVDRMRAEEVHAFQRG